MWFLMIHLYNLHLPSITWDSSLWICRDVYLWRLVWFDLRWGVYKNWGWRNQTQKRQEKKGGKEEKLQPKADYTAKGVEAAILATVKQWSCALSHHCSSLWTLGVALAPQPLPLETAAPRVLLTPERFSTQCVFLLFLLHPTGRAKGQISIPCQEKGQVGKEAKTRGILFSIIWRGWLQKWNQMLATKNQYMLDTYIVSSIMYASVTWAMKSSSKETCSLLTPQKFFCQYLKRWFRVSN